MKKKSFRRNVIEWGIIVIVFGGIYLSGYHTEVIGRLQQIILWTGLMQPDMAIPPEKQKYADYNWQLISQSGEIIAVENLKSKVLFVNFWATWCPPCVAEMPNINSLYQKLNNEKIIFLMISVDDSWKPVADFMGRKKFQFPVYRLNSAVPEVFSSRTIPTTFVVSPSGKIVVEKRGLAKYDTDTFRNFLIGMATDVQKEKLQMDTDTLK